MYGDLSFDYFYGGPGIIGDRDITAGKKAEYGALAYVRVPYKAYCRGITDYCVSSMTVVVHLRIISS